jgi:hypothetical protein
MRCKQTQVVVARSKEWTGDLRTDLRCPTPGCQQLLGKGSTKGNVSQQPEIPVLLLRNGEQVVLEDYDCSESDAKLFCDLFASVFNRLPQPARDKLLSHWERGCGSPHIWLLKDRKEWKGNGWAASSPDGYSMYFVSTLVGRIPNEHMQLAIAHELGHLLFIAGGEAHHKAAAPIVNKFFRDASSMLAFDEPNVDPLRKYRCEWLVWRLMESWGFDQVAAEVWMERNVIDDKDGIRVRDEPIPDQTSEAKCIAQRNEIEKKLLDMNFPPEFDQYRTNRDETKA